MLIELPLSQLPGNLALRKVGVRNWLTFIVVAWGAVQLGMAFINDWRELLLCRILLGAFEVSFNPYQNFQVLIDKFSGVIPSVDFFHHVNLVCHVLPLCLTQYAWPGISVMKFRHGQSADHSLFLT